MEELLSNSTDVITTSGTTWTSIICGVLIWLPLKIFFGYVTFQGVRLSTQMLVSSGKRGAFMMCVFLLFLGWSHMTGFLAHFSQQTFRKLMSQTDGARPFGGEGTIFVPGKTSHTLCTVLGLFSANWVHNVVNWNSLPRDIRQSARRVLSTILHSIFVIGCFLWWWLWLPRLVLNSLTSDITALEGVTLAMTHTFSFSVGIFFHQDYYLRQFDKLPDEAARNYYASLTIVSIAIPFICQIISAAIGWNFLQVVVQVPAAIFVLSSGIPNDAKGFRYLLWIVCISLTASLFLSSSLVIEPVSNYVPPSFFELSLDWRSYASYLEIPSKDFLLGLSLGVIMLMSWHKFATMSSDKPTGISGLSVKCQSKKSLEERSAKFPPQYPNGWYRLVDGDLLKPGDLTYVSCLGREFAVFRDSKGKAHVLEAICPHLGANLAFGKVVNDNVECPFHGWQWAGDGKCAHIPYKEGAPPATAKTFAYEVEEFANMVCVWYHDENKPSTWRPFHIKEIESNDFKFIARSTYSAEMHIQDFAENAADPAHFNVLHRDFALPFSFLSSFFYLTHEVTWRGGVSNAKDFLDHETDFAESETPYFASFCDFAELRWIFSDEPLAPRMTYAVVTFVGPGLIFFRFITKYGTVIMLKSMVPSGLLHQEISDQWWAESHVPKMFVEYVKLQADKAFMDDMIVWANKSYLHKPMVIREDGPIRKLRLWYKQFYTAKRELSCDAEDNAPEEKKDDVKVKKLIPIKPGKEIEKELGLPPCKVFTDW